MFVYNYKEMLRLLKIEQQCVKRASGLDDDFEGECDRDCANCLLVQKTEDLLDMYEKTIRLVEREVKRVEREKAYKQEAEARREYWDDLEKNDPEEYWRQTQYLATCD